MTINKKVDIYCTNGGNLGFMLIVGVAQSCQSGNHSRFVQEHIYITNQQKTSLYSTFLGSENFKWQTDLPLKMINVSLIHVT